ncbi:MAG: pancreas/duodenum homeobox protein 1 [Desulfatitalea sp.]|nr:pancreas/duodenum homeobox protein 1 [Desulfatitalea sp.]MBI5895117.1 pancreas/duodenum homeobox protein 1 [Desulfobacterales bacterium]
MKANTTDTFAELFTADKLQELFPAERADRFFDALLGDPKEGAYDIRLAYDGFREGQLRFSLELHQRPRKCLACNLTYGLPSVFSRHPIIDIQGVVDAIAKLLDGRGRCAGWKLGATLEMSRQLHVVPLLIDLA